MLDAVGHPVTACTAPGTRGLALDDLAAGAVADLTAGGSKGSGR